MPFRYNCRHRELAKGIWVKEPIIPITLAGKNGEKLDFTAILYSGSDFVLIPKEIADALGVDYAHGVEIKSKTFDGLDFITRLATVNMEIKKDRERIPIQCRAAICTNGPDYHHIILGSSFFEKFEITFDYPRNKFVIKRR